MKNYTITEMYINDPATTEPYPVPLHVALPIWETRRRKKHRQHRKQQLRQAQQAA